MKGMRVLVVDDDPSVRESLGKVLSGEGYEVALAADGQAALERFEQGAVDLLLLDLGLPIRNGWDTFERMTTRNPLMPVIIVTAQTDHYNVPVPAGVGALMEKPLDAPRLLQTIRELLAEPERARPQRTRAGSQDVRSAPGDGAAFLMKLREQHIVRFRGASATGNEQWRRT